MNNYMKLEIAAIGTNEAFARSTVAAFALSLNPSLSELSDVKTAVSEAVTNGIVHAYAGEEGKDGGNNSITIECRAEGDLVGGVLHIEVTDHGCGIEDVEKALQPFYTTRSEEERSGMGFTIMQTFTDGFSVTSEKGKGTKIVMSKRIGAKDGCDA